MKLPRIGDIIDALQRLGRRFDHAQFMGAVFVMAAISIAVTTPRGAIAYAVNTMHAPLDLLIAAFAISAAILFSKPSFKLFAVAHLPLVMFAVAAIAFAYSQPSSATSVTVYYCVMQVVIPLIARLPEQSRIRLHHVYGVLLLLIGLSIMAYPARNTVAYIENTYGIPSAFLGGSLIACAVWLLGNASASAFIYVSGLLVFYVSCVFVFAWSSNNYTSAFINLNLLVALFFTMTRAHRYFATQVNPTPPVVTTQGVAHAPDGV